MGHISAYAVAELSMSRAARGMEVEPELAAGLPGRPSLRTRITV